MERSNTISPQDATGKNKVLLDAVQEKLGMTPSMMCSMAQSPAVFEGCLNFSSALATNYFNLMAEPRVDYQEVLSLRGL